MSTQNFSYNFTTSKSPEEIFNFLMDPKSWWIGLHNEIIIGNSGKLNDEFTFSAANGVHNSVQKLVELIPNEKITWEVVDSNLTFLKTRNEWTGTKISFEILKEEQEIKILFRHEGLTPEFECYNGCSSAWTQYLENLDRKLNSQRLF
ncbi:SRPBCC domain-containing protein [Chryseobacterium wangxinyae]|uniref:SRPBCC family protein n=1 Tax=Chryseobacterium sp. CY350 TaxID=2997336 RepID=UPI00226D4510|nr:SRPBCC domain-containing protein [Chryseobacterium sp. CY350]MCY0977361.1 SRPBCC domain-containing protein [Chryseobacterium sp. CY350]WBZ95620.1 SRPBCC domain-containing protein [Chryseobacterium sp. CY350]